MVCEIRQTSLLPSGFSTMLSHVGVFQHCYTNNQSQQAVQTAQMFAFGSGFGQDLQEMCAIPSMIRMYACRHVCMHAWMDGWMHACTYVRTYVNTYVHTPQNMVRHCKIIYLCAIHDLPHMCEFDCTCMSIWCDSSAVLHLWTNTQPSYPLTRNICSSIGIII